MAQHTRIPDSPEDVRVFLDDPLTKASTTDPTVDADHGRIETRAVAISTDIDWLQERHQWPGLKAIGKVTRTREIGDKTSKERAYYLFSAPISAQRGGEVVRSHWGVENCLHWAPRRDNERRRRSKPHGQRTL